MLGLCALDYMGLCVHERLRLTDFVASCWTMCGLTKSVCGAESGSLYSASFPWGRTVCGPVSWVVCLCACVL